MRQQSHRWELRNCEGVVVGTLASRFKAPTDMRCIKAAVLAIATWSRARADPQYRQHLKNDNWQVVISELVCEPLRSGLPLTNP